MMNSNARLAALNEQAVPGTMKKLYDGLVNRKIRARYSQSAENAILRKKLAGIGTEEFEAYNAFAETCKAEAKAELGIE